MSRYFAQLTLVLPLLVSHSWAQVITLTRYRSACSATYAGSAATRTTTITSTSIVSPLPATDTALGDGTPFVLRVDRPGFPYLLGLSAPSYLAEDGATVLSKNDAAEFELANGTLILLQTGGPVGTAEDLDSALFPSVPIQYSPNWKRASSITTMFAVINETLRWNNTAFANRSASWYILGATASPRVYARFSGQLDVGDIPVVLVAQDVFNASLPSSSSELVTLSTTSLSSYITSSGAPPTLSSTLLESASSFPISSSSSTLTSASTPTSSSTSTSSSSSGLLGYSMTSNAFSSTSAGAPVSSIGSASSSSLIEVSPFTASDYTSVTGGPTGTSDSNSMTTAPGGSLTESVMTTSTTKTSASAFTSFSISRLSLTTHLASMSVVSTDESLSSDTTSSIRLSSITMSLDDMSSSSLQVSSTTSSSSQLLTSEVTTTMISTTTTIPVYSPTGTPVVGGPAACPVDSSREVQDRNGIYYMLACSYDSEPDAYRSASAPNGFNDCFGLCDNTTACTGFTYVGQPNGVGAGVCYFKSGAVTPQPGAPNFVAAYRLSYGAGQDGVFPDINWPVTTTMGGMSSTMTTSDSTTSLKEASTSARTSSTTMFPFSSDNIQSSSFSDTSNTVTALNSGTSTPASTDVMSSGFTSDASSISATNLEILPSTQTSMESITTDEPAGSISSIDMTTNDVVTRTSLSSSSLMSSLGNPSTTPRQTSDVFSAMSSSVSDKSASETFSEAIPSSISSEITMTTDSSSVAGKSDFMPSSTSLSELRTRSASTTSTTSATATASPAYTLCPEANGTTQYDPFGNGYTSYCGFDSDYGAFQTVYVAENNAFTDCFRYCDNFPECTAFTFETTICYLKAGLGNMVIANSAFVYAVRIPPGTSSSSSASRSMTSTSSLLLASSTASASPSTITSASTSRRPASSTTSTTRTSTISFTPGEPTACTFGDPNQPRDDTACKVELPFDMQIYDQTDYLTYASVNGFIALSNFTNEYDAPSLPTSKLPTSAVLPLWDDLYLDPTRVSQNESITYTLTGTSVLYNFTLSKPGNWEQYVFSVYYSTLEPGVFTYEYLMVGGEQAAGLLVDDGRTAIVGVQGEVDGQARAVMYSYEEAVILPGLRIRCDTVAGVCEGSDERIRPRP